MLPYIKLGCAGILSAVLMTGCERFSEDGVPFISETSISIPANTFFGSGFAFEPRGGVYEGKEIVIETLNVSFSNLDMTSPDDTVLKCVLNGDINGSIDEDVDLPTFNPSVTADFPAIGGQRSAFAVIYPIRMHICPTCQLTFRCDTNSPDAMTVSVTFLGYLVSPGNAGP